MNARTDKPERRQRLVAVACLVLSSIAILIGALQLLQRDPLSDVALIIVVFAVLLMLVAIRMLFVNPRRNR